MKLVYQMGMVVVVDDTRGKLQQKTELEQNLVDLLGSGKALPAGVDIERVWVKNVDIREEAPAEADAKNK